MLDSTQDSGYSLSGHSQQRPPSLVWPQISAAATIDAFTSATATVNTFTFTPKATYLKWTHCDFLSKWCGWPY